MLSLKQLVIDSAATLGTPLLVCKAAPTFEYVNGSPTNKRDGTRYTVAAPAAEMATVNIKVSGPQALDMGGKAIVPVEFDSLELYIYYRDGKPMVAGRAKGVHKVDKL